jgi:hypothetical protein
MLRWDSCRHVAPMLPRGSGPMVPHGLCILAKAVSHAVTWLLGYASLLRPLRASSHVVAPWLCLPAESNSRATTWLWSMVVAWLRLSAKAASRNATWLEALEAHGAQHPIKCVVINLMDNPFQTKQATLFWSSIKIYSSQVKKNVI